MIQKVTALAVREKVLSMLGTEDPQNVLDFLFEEYARLYNAQNGAAENYDQIKGFHETVVACLVEQLGGEARIPLADIEDPPPLYMDDDPVSGDWIYATETLDKEAL